MTFSVPVSAHGNHGHATGTWRYLGIAFNLVELGKHVWVTKDQVMANEEDRDIPVLVGNVVSMAAHLLNAQAFFKALGKENRDSRFFLPLLVLANGFTVADMFVDGITSREYWRDLSFKSGLIVSTSLTCLALNLQHLKLQMMKKPKN